MSPSDGGPDYRQAVQPLHKSAWSNLVQDPYRFSADWFLAARGKQIRAHGPAGRTGDALHTIGEVGEVREPRPHRAPPARAGDSRSRTDWQQATGRMVLSDVYQGPQHGGRGAWRHPKLLVLEILPKQVNFSGGPDLVSWLGTFTLERVMGTVPVEAGRLGLL